jgi:hypothetical protein
VAVLDRAKEEVAYLRFWQGIVVVTDTGRAGSTIAHSERNRLASSDRARNRGLGRAVNFEIISAILMLVVILTIFGIAMDAVHRFDKRRKPSENA